MVERTNYFQIFKISSL